jgi:lipopolysaccharide transport system permease protein
MNAIMLALWNYRGFIVGSVKREFQLKYRNSMLGAAWTLLNPLAMIIVYTVIFAQIMRARLPGIDSSFAYSIYLCAGILTWGLFVEIVGRTQNIFIEHANLLKKLSFPRLTLPIIIVMSSLLNFTIIFGLFTAFLLVSNNFPGWVFLSLVPVLMLQVLFAISLGIIVGVLNVFFRDVGQFFSIILQFWFWLTPIVYPIDILSEGMQYYLRFNPMLPFITAYQGVLVTGTMPDWQSFIWMTLISMALFVFGYHLFRKRSGEMVDEL